MGCLKLSILKNLIVALGFICALGLSCRQNKKPEELINTFYKHESELTSIIKELQTNKNLDSIFSNVPEGLPQIETSYPIVFRKLKSLKIKHASSHPSFPKGTRWFYFETEWPNEYLICLIYNAYDSTQSKKGYYKKSEVSNETWGLGNNWQMFRLVKYERD